MLTGGDRMNITEKRGFFQIQVIVSAVTVNVDNIDINFNGITLYSEDEDKLIEIKGRRTVIEPERCSEGLRINLYILNEGDNPEERIDYLIDEDYEIETVDISVVHKKNGKVFPIRVNEKIGEQVMKEVPVEIPQELQDASDYVMENITEGNESITGVVFDTIKKSKELQTFINKVMDVYF